MAFVEGAHGCGCDDCLELAVYKAWGIVGKPFPGVKLPRLFVREVFPFPLVGSERTRLRTKRSAIYLLVNDRALLYVGQTSAATGVWGRVKSHLARDRFEGDRRPSRLVVLWVRCQCVLNHLEIRLIRRLKPLVNEGRDRELRHSPHPGCWCDPCRRGNPRP